MRIGIAVTSIFFVLVLKSAAQPAFLTGDPQVGITEDTTANLNLYTLKYLSGKVYLYWETAQQELDGTYIIFRSADNKKYEPIGYQAEPGVSLSQPVCYYFTDDKPLNGRTFYMILHYRSNRTFHLSAAKPIDIE